MQFSIESFRSNFGRLLERELNAAGKRGVPLSSCSQDVALEGDSLVLTAVGGG
jgi:hypothetical protein